MKQVFLDTFGCQMNVADTDRMELILFHSGYQRTQEKEDADLILVNTCSIREKAEQKIFSLFGELKPLKTNLLVYIQKLFQYLILQTKMDLKKLKSTLVRQEDFSWLIFYL